MRFEEIKEKFNRAKSNQKRKTLLPLINNWIVDNDFSTNVRYIKFEQGTPAIFFDGEKLEIVKIYLRDFPEMPELTFFIIERTDTRKQIMQSTPVSNILAIKKDGQPVNKIAELNHR